MCIVNTRPGCPHPATAAHSASVVQIPIDLCQPTWSNAYRFTREVLAES